MSSSFLAGLSPPNSPLSDLPRDSSDAEGDSSQHEDSQTSKANDAATIQRLQPYNIELYTKSDGSPGTSVQLIEFVDLVKNFITQNTTGEGQAPLDEVQALIKMLCHSQEMYKIAEIGCWQLKGTGSASRLEGWMPLILQDTIAMRPTPFRYPDYERFIGVKRWEEVMLQNFLTNLFASTSIAPHVDEIPLQDHITAIINKIMGTSIPGFNGKRPKIYKPGKRKVAFTVTTTGGTLPPTDPALKSAIYMRLPFAPKQALTSASDYAVDFPMYKPVVPVANSARSNVSDTVTNDGLQNYGNTCYANSVFVAASTSPDLVDGLQQSLQGTVSRAARHASTILVGLDPRQPDPQLVHTALREFMKWLQEKSDNTRFEAQKKDFRAGNRIQQDISEFLAFIQDHVLTGLNQYLSLTIAEIRECTSCQWTRTGGQEIFTVFPIAIKTTGQTHEFIDLVRNCLDSEILEYRCDRPDCDGQTIEKRTTFRSARDVIFHLKRVQTTNFGRTSIKSDDLVSLPEGVFNLNTDEARPIWLYVSAVIHHIGPAVNSGHYYAFQGSEPNTTDDRTWTKHEDGRISTSDWTRVNTKDVAAIVCRVADATMIPLDDNTY